MYFPNELYQIIKTYKKLFERRESYEKLLDCYASAIMHKPEIKMLSQKEARQGFVRLFPKYRDFIRHVAKDLERFLGPPVNIGDDIKVWFMLHKDSQSFPLKPPFEYLVDYYEYQEDEPERMM